MFLLRKILNEFFSIDTQIIAKESNLTFFLLIQKTFRINIMDKKGFRYCFVGIIMIKMPEIHYLLKKKAKIYFITGTQQSLLNFQI